MSTVATENETIAGTVQLYIDGVAKGDTAKLEQAFHRDARMFGAVDGQRYDVPISEMFAMVESQPADTDGSFRASIQVVAEEGDAALATVEEHGFWGTLSFVDYFSLTRIDGIWKIANKTFMQTAGTLSSN